MKPDQNDYLSEKENFEETNLLGHLKVDIDFESSFFFIGVNGATINQDKKNAFIELKDLIIIDEDYYYNGCFCTLEDGDKLGDFFDCLPYGIINKTIPGIGATTLEIKSDRNSIIVVPTKSLAYTKYKRTEAESGENSCMYIGSPFGTITKDITQKDINTYLEINNGKKKKFLVVADSLPKVLRAIGKYNYTDYFLMIDEIDTLQTDSVYRPALEKVIDYYEEFKKENRAVVSATMIELTHPELLKETTITTSYGTIPSRNIQLRHTNNEDLCTIVTINEILKDKPDDKIVIAYNSLDGILVCIELLKKTREEVDADFNDKIGILCSEMSKSKAGDYYIEINEDNTLPKQIVFMTCAYFVGVDIEEQYHSIAVSTFNQPFTLLSTNRLAQIVGRCRVGALSETVIYTTKRIEVKEKFNDFKEKILKKAEVFTKAIQAFKDVLVQAPELAEAEVNFNEIINYFAYEKVNNDYPVKLLRANINNEIVPSYFNIDALLERWYLHHSLYYERSILEKELKKQNHLIRRNDYYHDYLEEQKDILASVKKEFKQDKLDESLLDAKTKLMEWDKITSAQIKTDELYHLIKSSSKQLKKFYERFKKFYPYFETEYLVDLLIEHHNDDERKYKTFNNSLVFWALDEKHPFKILVIEKFGYKHEVGNLEAGKPLNISTDDNLRTMKIIFDSFFQGYAIKEKVQKELLKCFFKRSRTKKYFKVIGLNPMEFAEPKTKIHESVQARELIKLFELQ
jgi:hypothetical protein